MLQAKLEELGLHLPGAFPTVSAGQDLTNMTLIREISGVMGVDKEDSTRAVITKGLMANFNYFHVLLPMLGYHWLDFYINDDEDDLYAMWDRSWHATMDTIGTAPFTGSGQALVASASTQRSPYLVS